MPDIRLIAADMDGTLLNEQGKISTRTLRAIQKAQEKGIIFSMCTGRFPEHCLAFAREAGLKCSVISSNGSVAYDGQSGRIIAQHLMPAASAWQVWQLVRRYPLKCRVTMPGCYVDRYQEPLDFTSHFNYISQIMKRDYDVAYETGEEAMERRMRQPIYKTYIYPFDSPEARERMRHELEQIPGISVTSSGPRNVETMPVGVDKGTGLAELAAFYGIPLENVMAFGDYDNDLPMFRRAVYPVAMGNAKEDVKRAAWRVTAPNTEDGLAQAIEKYVLS